MKKYRSISCRRLRIGLSAGPQWTKQTPQKTFSLLNSMFLYLKLYHNRVIPLHWHVNICISLCKCIFLCKWWYISSFKVTFLHCWLSEKNAGVIGWKGMTCCIGYFAIKMYNVNLHQPGKIYPLFIYHWNFLLNPFIKDVEYLRNGAVRQKRESRIGE